MATALVWIGAMCGVAILLAAYAVRQAAAANSPDCTVGERIQGIVVGPGGAAVADAYVGVLLDDTIRACLAVGRRSQVLHAVTDASGRFDFSPPTSSSLTLVVRARNLEPARLKLDDTRATTPEMSRIQLRAGVAIRGTLVDERGRATQNAQINLQRLDDLPDTIPEAQRYGASSSNAQGQFQISGLEPGRYSLTVEHPKLMLASAVRLQVPQPRGALSLTLYEKALIEGAVVDRESKGIAAAQLIAETGSTRLQAAASAAGTFRLGPFPRGTRVSVVTSAEGYGTARSDAFVAPSKGVLVRLHQSSLFRGTVIDGNTKRPIPAFSIEFHRRPGVPARVDDAPEKRNFTSSEGAFEWNDMSPGVWAVSIRATGFAPLELTNLEISPGMGNDYSFELKGGSELRGRVIDQVTGEAIRSALITWDSHRRTLEQSRRLPVRPATHTQSDGTFILKDVPDPLILSVGAAGYTMRELEFSGQTEVEVELQRAASISGTATLSDGALLSRASISVISLASGSGGRIPTDDQGRFVISGLDAGDYAISAEAEHRQSKPIRITLGDGEQRDDLRLTVERGNSVRGTISGLAPGERDECVARIESSTSSITARCKEDGTFEVHGVAAGAARVSVRTALDRELEKSIDVTEGAGAFVAFDFPAETRTVHGVVTRSGNPVPFVLLKARPAADDLVLGEGETNQAGEYRIVGLSGSEYLVSVRGGDRYRVPASKNDHRLNISLPACAIRGVVLDAQTHEPLRNAVVQVQSSGDEGGGGGRQETDVEGKFLVSGLKSGSHLVVVYKAGYALARRSVLLEDEDTLEASFSLSRDRGISIRVRDAQSRIPIREVSVAAQSLEGRLLVNLVLNEEGVGRLPSAFIDHRLSIDCVRCRPVEISLWRGEQLELFATREP